MTICKIEDKEKISDLLDQAVEKTNKIVGLTERIEISKDWGKNYSECH